MQTFLPYSSYEKSAERLDNKRLNKQVLECYQILKALNGETKGWVNHPATLMWKGFEQSLVSYAIVCCNEYTKRFGKKSGLLEKIEAYKSDQPNVKPWWVGLESFHQSHRSNLYRKNSEYYHNFKDDYDKVQAYCWPIIVDKKKFLRYKCVGEKNYNVEAFNE